MEYKIIFALIAFLLSLLFVRWANNYSSSGGYINLDEFERILILLAGGFPLTLLVFLIFSTLAKLSLVNVSVENKMPFWILNSTVVLQFIIWSQLIAFWINL